MPAAPSVRRLAREIGVNISEVEGTGPGGRISDDDVKAAAKSRLERGDGAGAGTQAPLPDFSQWGEIHREKMSRVRQITAESTAAGWSSIPHVTQFDKADVTGLEEFRQQYKKAAEKQGVKLTVTALLVKVLGFALDHFPRFNASLDMNAGEIIYKDFINIGVAVDTDRGLLVPVVKNVESKSILEIAGELGDLAKRARSKKISPDEMKGGSFIVSNLGGIGGTQFTPLIYPPQVAILGVSRASTEPVWQDGEFVPRQILPLSLSYDHRIIDGADGARFLRWICSVLEHPLSAFIDQPKKE